MDNPPPPTPASVLSEPRSRPTFRRGDLDTNKTSEPLRFEVFDVQDDGRLRVRDLT